MFSSPQPAAPAPPPPSAYPVLASTSSSDAAAIGFVLQLVRALHGYGESAPRLEDLLHAMVERLGLPEVQLFAAPTGLMVAFGPLERQRTHLLRVTPAGVDLGKLAQVEHVALEVAGGRCPPAEGVVRIRRVAEAAPPYPPWLTVLAYALSSGAAAQFLGGRSRDVVVATALGLGVGLHDRVVGRRPRLGGVFEPLTAFGVSLVAVVLAASVGPLSALVVTIAGLIVLIPGLTLTTALNELANRHLASGTARLSGAFTTFLSIAFGVALGNRVGVALLAVGPPRAAHGTSAPLPAWAGLLALVLAPLCFVVILRARWRDAPFIVAGGVLGVVGGRWGAAALGAELGAFAGALVLALASRGYERWRRRPSAVVLVPGLLLLVPGTVGFRSLAALMERQVLTGVETAVSALVTAIALVAGVLVAGVLVPERRLPPSPGAGAGHAAGNGTG